jgi:hypothetical protein
MANQIYLIQQDGKLQSMSEMPYDNEDLLQKLLERHSELLGVNGRMRVVQMLLTNRLSNSRTL